MRVHRWLAVVLGLLTACAGLRHSPETRYQGIVLNARELGADPLERLVARDDTIRDYVARAGLPDFVYVADPDDIELIYTRQSRLVHFHRTGSHASAVGELSPLPAEVVNVLAIDLRAGTPGPLTEFPVVNCWRVEVERRSCRTCCKNALSCSTACVNSSREAGG